MSKDWGEVEPGTLVEPPGNVGIIIKSSKEMADAILVNKKSGIYGYTDKSYRFYMVITTDQDKSRKKLIRRIFEYNKA